MSSGQTLLALGAVALLMYIVLNVNRVYVSAATENINNQRNFDAINYSQTLNDLIYAHTGDYAAIDSLFGNLNNVNSAATRLQYVSSIGDTLYATIIFGAEKVTAAGATGRVGVIRVYTNENGTFERLVESRATLIDIGE